MVLTFFRFNEFDHKFFGISDSEVEQMDPQQKQLLQCVYRALENAGIPMEKASGTRTGVFFGKSVKMVCNFFKVWGNSGKTCSVLTYFSVFSPESSSLRF